MQQAMLFSFVLLMPFILLSGLATPIGNMPVVLQYLTFINPLRYAIDIAAASIWKAPGFGAALARPLAAGRDRRRRRCRWRPGCSATG